MCNFEHIRPHSRPLVLAAATVNSPRPANPETGVVSKFLFSRISASGNISLMGGRWLVTGMVTAALIRVNGGDDIGKARSLATSASDGNGIGADSSVSNASVSLAEGTGSNNRLTQKRVVGVRCSSSPRRSFFLTRLFHPMSLMRYLAFGRHLEEITDLGSFGEETGQDYGPTPTSLKIMFSAAGDGDTDYT
ncbi:hypothetical protein Tco_0402139 [Tanacetum coccineum]